jgi:two-component system, NtrC family, sensor kinase
MPGLRMVESQPRESRSPAVVYLDADPGELRLFAEQFGERFRVSLSPSVGALLEQVDSVAPVAALLSDHRSSRELLEVAPSVLPDTERLLLVARSAELSQARAAVERGAARRYFVKPWIPGEMGAALDDAVRIFELRSTVRMLRARLGASERLATLGRVSAGIAHELSGPAAYIAQNAADLRRELAGVATYVRRMSRIRPDARVLEQLRESAEIAQDMEAGAEHVRQVTRGLTGQLRTDAPVELCDVAVVAQQVVRLVRPELRGKAMLVTLGGKLDVRASPLRLAQVLINLVVNAGQAVASLERAEPGHIEVRWLSDRNFVRIEVVDDGPGLAVSPDELGMEVLVTTKAPGVGTGLGLSLCREQLADMGGTLTLFSLPGQGTTARIELPRQS